jgi:hypothetical protein
VHRARHILLILGMGVVSPHAAAAPPRYAQRGEAATGAVVKEDGGELQLNTTPCKSSANIVIFRGSYSKESIGAVKCENSQIALVQALQR